MDRPTTLTEGSIVRGLAGLAAPMMLGVSSSILVQMLEIGFIGQLGTEPLAAVAFTFPATMALSSIALGISIGASSVIARRAGAGEWQDVRRLSTHALLLVGTLMSALSLAGWLTIDVLFTALGATPDVLVLIHSYLDIYYPSVVLFTLAMVAGSVLRATGNARVPGVVMTVGALVNLGLDPLLIFGLWGLPRFELAGAAIAMLLSRALTLAVLLHYAARRQRMLEPLSFHRVIDSSRRILHVGLPAIATQLIGPVTAGIITALLARHGEAVVAGFGVAVRIEAVSVMLLFALSGSIGPFVGQNWGANREDRVAGGMRAAYLFSVVWGLAAALILIAAGDIIVPLIDDNAAVVRTATLYLGIVPLSYGAWGVLMMSSAAFNSLGRPLPSTAMSFTRMFVVYVPLAWSLDRLFGYAGVFVATGLSNFVMGVIAFFWFRRAFVR